MFKVYPATYQTAGRQDQGDARLNLTPSVILSSNYVIMVTETVCNIFSCFLYKTHLITLYFNRQHFNFEKLELVKLQQSVPDG
jgi:hypothetical protein